MPVGIYAIVSGADHDLLMKAIEPYEPVAYYGNMDPEVKEWLVVTVLLPERTARILSRSLHDDYGVTVKLCQNEEHAKKVVRSHPAWD